jgi:hypothetical protein
MEQNARGAGHSSRCGKRSWARTVMHEARRILPHLTVEYAIEEQNAGGVTALYQNPLAQPLRKEAPCELVSDTI